MYQSQFHLGMPYTSKSPCPLSFTVKTRHCFLRPHFMLHLALDQLVSVFWSSDFAASSWLHHINLNLLCSLSLPFRVLITQLYWIPPTIMQTKQQDAVCKILALTALLLCHCDSSSIETSATSHRVTLSVILQDLNPRDTASFTSVSSSSDTENHWQLLPSICKLSSLLYVSLLNLFQQSDLDTLTVQMMFVQWTNKCTTDQQLITLLFITLPLYISVLCFRASYNDK